MTHRPDPRTILCAIACVAFSACAAVSPASSYEPSPEPLAFEPPQFVARSQVTASLLVGKRSLDSDFAPADSPTAFGLDFDVRQQYQKLGFEVGYQCSSDEADEHFPGAQTVTARAFLHEIYTGGRWQWDPFDSALHPYVGVGVSALFGTFEVEGSGTGNKEVSYAVGVYGHAGLRYDLGEHIAIGIDARRLYSTRATLQSATTFDHDQLALTIGWVF